MNDPDVIDRAAGLAPGDPLHTARRFRAKVVEATQASHDALLMQPVPGLSPADRLRVAVCACEAAGAPDLAGHYAELLASDASRSASPSPAPTMTSGGRWLTSRPTRASATGRPSRR